MSDENIGRVFVRDTGKKTLVIIPAYNEAENIEKTVKDIIENAPECDFLVINDCSADDTEKICKDKGFDVLSLPVNLGIGGAVQTGYRYAAKHGYGRALQFDGDGQHNPEYIKPMLDEMINKFKIKRIIASGLMLAMCGFPITGCGKNDREIDKNPTKFEFDIAKYAVDKNIIK